MLCDEYRRKPPEARKRVVEDGHLSLNCLGKHKLSECSSKRLCSVCADKHHTSLHDAFRRAPAVTTDAKTAHVAQNSLNRRTTVLLATARIRISDRFGNLQEARALIDQGSEATMITENLAQRLRLPRQPSSVAVFGVGGQQTGTAKGHVSLTVWPLSGRTSVSTSALILSRLTGYASTSEAPSSEWKHIKGLELADPRFASNDRIDVLIGADIYASIVREGLRTGNRLQPVAQKTIFGWILSGKIRAMEQEEEITTHQYTIGEPLSVLVRKFWEQEELPFSPSPLTRDEQACEDLFIRTHSRNSEGRYIVRLPVLKTLPDLSETRVAAARSLVCTEKRFQKDHQFGELYTEFMKTYEELNYMTKLDTSIHAPRGMCYLPHHGVLRESNSSTRPRVVFNGFWTVSSGTSLNQNLLFGKNLLPPLTDILLRWRWHRHVIATDVEKMYWQIIVHKDDRDLQRIL